MFHARTGPTNNVHEKTAPRTPWSKDSLKIGEEVLRERGDQIILDIVKNGKRKKNAATQTYHTHSDVKIYIIPNNPILPVTRNSLTSIKYQVPGISERGSSPL